MAKHCHPSLSSQSYKFLLAFEAFSVKSHLRSAFIDKSAFQFGSKTSKLKRKISAFSDSQLRDKTYALKERAQSGESLDSILRFLTIKFLLQEAFAVVREASKRSCNCIHQFTMGVICCELFNTQMLKKNAEEDLDDMPMEMLVYRSSLENILGLVLSEVVMVLHKGEIA
ncbi:Protein translocase subunit SecA, chloroplastic, partial [Cucurbita argyrosperma subsp. sororia]